MSGKYNILKRKFSQLKEEHALCKQEKVEPVLENEPVKVKDPQIEICYLKIKIKVPLKDLSTFTIGHENLLRMVGNNINMYDRSGLGFVSETVSDSSSYDTTPSDLKFVLSGPPLLK